MLARYGREPDAAPDVLPYGWAAVLYLYDLRRGQGGPAEELIRKRLVRALLRLPSPPQGWRRSRPGATSLHRGLVPWSQMCDAAVSMPVFSPPGASLCRIVGA